MAMWTGGGKDKGQSVFLGVGFDGLSCCLEALLFGVDDVRQSISRDGVTI
ncbi:hypothetical protein [Aliivibrio wodanis]